MVITTFQEDEEFGRKLSIYDVMTFDIRSRGRKIERFVQGKREKL